jgi:hypothetical protein
MANEPREIQVIVWADDNTIGEHITRFGMNYEEAKPGETLAPDDAPTGDAAENVMNINFSSPTANVEPPPAPVPEEIEEPRPVAKKGTKPPLPKRPARGQAKGEAADTGEEDLF